MIVTKTSCYDAIDTGAIRALHNIIRLNVVNVKFNQVQKISKNDKGLSKEFRLAVMPLAFYVNQGRVKTNGNIVHKKRTGKVH